MVKPGTYFVDASASASTVSRTRLMDEFHAKARELCGPAGYDFETAVGADSVGPKGGSIPNVTGYVTCKGAPGVEAVKEGPPPANVAADLE